MRACRRYGVSNPRPTRALDSQQSSLRVTTADGGTRWLHPCARLQPSCSTGASGCSRVAPMRAGLQARTCADAPPSTLDTRDPPATSTRRWGRLTHGGGTRGAEGPTWRHPSPVVKHTLTTRTSHPWGKGRRRRLTHTGGCTGGCTWEAPADGLIWRAIAPATTIVGRRPRSPLGGTGAGGGGRSKAPNGEIQLQCTPGCGSPTICYYPRVKPAGRRGGAGRGWLK